MQDVGVGKEGGRLLGGLLGERRQSCWEEWGPRRQAVDGFEQGEGCGTFK